MTSSPLDSAPADGAPVRHNPFVGPRPFQSGERLFGRLKETRELYYLLSAERIVWLHSPSGAGKTSLIWASLAPRLEHDGFNVCPSIRVNLDLPQIGGEEAPGSTNRYLMSALLSLEEGLPPDQRQSMASLAGQPLSDYLAGRLAANHAGGAGTLLVFDQFEEILTVDPLRLEEKQVFFQALGAALRDPSLWALFALREEYLAQLEPFIDWIPTRWSNTFRLELLGASAVREVLQRTAALGERAFTDPAAETLFADLARTKIQQPDGRFRDEIGRFVEPVQLQVVCRRLWDAMPADERSIDPEDLAQFGDVSQALGAYYDDAIARIANAPTGDADLALERGIRDWFGQRLVTPTGTRGQVLRGAEASEGLPNGVIEDLLNSHLVRGEKRAGATWYELAHDRLIQPIIDSNRVWLDQHLHPFQRRAARWVEQGRPANGGDHVLRGRALKEALRFQRDHPTLVSEDEGRLIGISRSARRMRLLTQGGLAVIVLLCLTFGVIAYWLKAQAEEKERAAWYQVAVGHWKDAVNARDRDPLTAAHHFAQAAERFDWAQSPKDSVSTLLALKFIIDRPILQSVVAHGSRVSGFVLSADGSRILTWGQDDVARLWDSDTGERPTSLLQEEEPVVGAQFSADASRILTWSPDRKVRLWDSRSGKPVAPPLRHEGLVRGAQFGAGTSHVLTWSGDGTARLWDGRKGQAITPKLKHQGGCLGPQLSADASSILTWSDDGTARLWDSRTGQAIPPPLKHEGAVRGAQFSADGSRVLTWSEDGTARLWDRHSGRPLVPPLKHSGAVEGARFSADGSRVITWSGDFLARLWDSHSGEALTPPLRHEGVCIGPQLSADASRLITWSHDGTGWLWDSRTGQAITPPLKHEGALRGAQFSADGSRVLTWSDDGTTKLWDSRSAEFLMLPLKQDEWVEEARFSPDESRILTWSADGTTRVWDSRARTPPLASLKQEGAVMGARLSADESQLLTWSDDGTARLWDSRTGQAITPSLKHEGAVRGAQFSADGSRILTWSEDGTARLWKNLDGTPLTAPLQHEGPVSGAQFSADESRILTWSQDGTVRLWDSHSGKPLAPPFKHDGSVEGVRFSPDGSRILTWGQNGTARLWDSASGAAIKPMFKHQGSVEGAQFSADGSRLLTWSADGRDGAGWLWDCRSGQPLIPRLEQDRVFGARFSSDESRILTWGGDWPGSARLWDSHNGALLVTFEHARWVAGAQFSADDSRILTWSGDDTARLWDSHNGEPVTPLLKHDGLVEGAMFSPDESRILTWSGDHTARLWDIRSGAAVAPPFKHEGPVNGAQFSRDGSRLLTWSQDGTVRFWDIAIDKDWPAQMIVLRTEVETGTSLTQTGELKALPTTDWQRKRWCEYDAIRHDLKRLTEAEWAESQRLCRMARDDARAGP